MKKNKKSLLFSIFGMSSIILPMTIVACQQQAKESNGNKDNKDQTNKPDVNPINPGNGEQNDPKPPVENPSNPEDGGKPGDKPEPEKNKSEKSVLFNSIAKLYLSSLTAKESFKNNASIQQKLTELSEALNNQDLSEGAENNVLDFLTNSFALELSKLELDNLLETKLKVTTEPSGVTEEQIIATFNKPFGQQQNNEVTDQINDSKQKFYSFIKDLKNAANIIKSNYIFLAAIPAFDQEILNNLAMLTNEGVEGSDNPTIEQNMSHIYESYKLMKQSSFLTLEELKKINQPEAKTSLVGIKMLQKMTLELLFKYNSNHSYSSSNEQRALTGEITNYLTDLGNFLNKENKNFDEINSKSNEFYNKVLTWNSQLSKTEGNTNLGKQNGSQESQQEERNKEFNSLVDTSLTPLKNDISNYINTNLTPKKYLYKEAEDFKRILLVIEELIAKKDTNISIEDLEKAKEIQVESDRTQSDIMNEVSKWVEIVASKNNDSSYIDSLTKLRKSYFIFDRLGQEILSKLNVSSNIFNEEQKNDEKEIIKKFQEHNISGEYNNSFFDENGNQAIVKSDKSQIASKEQVDALYEKIKSLFTEIKTKFNSSMDKQEQTRSLKLNESDYVIE